MLQQNTKSVQTAFRFSPELLLRMKNRARLRGQSLNAYVEQLIAKDLGDKSERYKALYADLSRIKLPDKIPDRVNAFMDRHKVEFTSSELEQDERLSYLLSK